MKGTYWRYELLLPMRYNDGSAVPPELIDMTLDELHEQFGAESYETQAIRGNWERHGINYSDDSVRVFVDVHADTPSKPFFLAYKQKLKARFDQQEIWITMHPLEVL